MLRAEMNVIYGYDGLLCPPWMESTVAIGHFDGVHVGHQAVIGAAVRDARAHGRPAIVVTFDRNPIETLRPGHAPKYLSTVSQRIERIAAMEVDHLLLIPFDVEFAHMPWTRFAEDILRDRLRCKTVVTGDDFRFGHGREGSAETIGAHPELGMDAIAVSPVGEDGHRVSSTEIRAAIESGDVERAARLLGRAYELVGVVVKGDKVGRTLGYPTLNLTPLIPMATPADGVYAGRTIYGAAAVSVGVRPAVGGGPRLVEAFLMDYVGPDLYGRSVGLQFVARLREERDFPSLELLKEQISLDVEECRRLLNPALL